MNPPDWQSVMLEEGIVRELSPDPGRIVLWVPRERDASFQYWERIANVARGEVRDDKGLSTTAVSSLRVRQRLGGIVGQLWSRLRSSGHERGFQLPNGAAAEQCGERQSDMLLVWPNDANDVLDEAPVKAQWAGAGRIQRLGPGLFLVAGLESQSAARSADGATAPIPAADRSPREHAEKLLAAARQAGAPDKEATALTDLGSIQLNEGDPQGAIASLEQALAIARQIDDTALEADALGNLGMAMLTVRRPAQARALFEQALAHARIRTDQFAKKLALERLALASWSLRDFPGSLRLLDEALPLARQFGDTHQEANLLWQQGIQYAELGQREQAIAKAEESVALFKGMGRPQAAAYGAYLQKYRMGITEEAPPTGAGTDQSAQAFLGGAMVASVMAGQTHAESRPSQGTAGPGLLRMALSATKAMANFAGSGFKTTSPDVQRRRLQTCAVCEHHTGLRCKICGCFTNAKARILHETCPIGKWPA